jgi:hypothetical protein
MGSSSPGLFSGAHTTLRKITGRYIHYNACEQPTWSLRAGGTPRTKPTLLRCCTHRRTTSPDKQDASGPVTPSILTYFSTAPRSDSTALSAACCCLTYNSTPDTTAADIACYCFIYSARGAGPSKWDSQSDVAQNYRTAFWVRSHKGSPSSHPPVFLSAALVAPETPLGLPDDAHSTTHYDKLSKL